MEAYGCRRDTSQRKINESSGLKYPEKNLRNEGITLGPSTSRPDDFPLFNQSMSGETTNFDDYSLEVSLADKDKDPPLNKEQEKKERRKQQSRGYGKTFREKTKNAKKEEMLLVQKLEEDNEGLRGTLSNLAKESAISGTPIDMNNPVSQVNFVPPIAYGSTSQPSKVFSMPPHLQKIGGKIFTPAEEKARKEHRKQKNAEYAEQSRAKKKIQDQELKKKREMLEEENKRLKTIIATYAPI